MTKRKFELVRTRTTTATTTDTAEGICAMLMQGSTPDDLLRREKTGVRIDPAVIEKGVELAIKKLRHEAERDFVHAAALERHSAAAALERYRGAGPEPWPLAGPERPPTSSCA